VQELGGQIERVSHSPSRPTFWVSREAGATDALDHYFRRPGGSHFSSPFSATPPEAARGTVKAGPGKLMRLHQERAATRTVAWAHPSGGSVRCRSFSSPDSGAIAVTLRLARGPGPGRPSETNIATRRVLKNGCGPRIRGRAAGVAFANGGRKFQRRESAPALTPGTALCPLSGAASARSPSSRLLASDPAALVTPPHAIFQHPARSVGSRGGAPLRRFAADAPFHRRENRR
jgi:hypothetical protein